MLIGRKQIFSTILLIFVTNVSSQNVTSSTSSDATTNTSETLISSSSTLTTVTTTTNNNNKDSSNSTTVAIDNITSVIPVLEEDNTTTSGSFGTAEPGAATVTETSVTTLELNADNATTFGNVTENSTSFNGSDLDTNSTENATETGLSESSSFSLLGGTVDLQTQVYIISGTFGLVAFLLIVLLLSLAFSVAKIKDQLLDTESRYIVDREDRVRGYQNGGYHGGDMVQHGGQERTVDTDPGSRGDTRDLSKMGYSIYSGNRQTSSEHIPMQNVSRSHMMKYEEGVIPINSEHDDR